MKQFYNYTPRLLFHYENVIRPDLLLKCNYKNIMEVPFLREIKITSYTNVPGVEAQARLAIEILSGTCSGRINTNKSSNRRKKKHQFLKRSLLWKTPKNHNMQAVSIKGKLMYLFLDKIISILSLDKTYQNNKIKLVEKEAWILGFPVLSPAPIVATAANPMSSSCFAGETRRTRFPSFAPPVYGFINIRLNFSELYLLPEVTWHSSLFESISAIDLSIVTSAKNLEETNLLWSGFMQKENSTHDV